MPDPEVAVETDDSVAADIGAAWDAAETAPVVETPVVEAAPEPVIAEGEQPRGPDGKFLPKDAAAAPDKPAEKVVEKPGEVAPVVAATPETPAATVTHAPPPGWSIPAKQAFDALPPAVKDAIAHRETEVNNGLAKLAEFKGLEPYMDVARRSGVTLPQMIENYRAAEHALATDGLNAIKWLAQSYNIDLTKLGAAPVAGDQNPQPRQDPKLSQIEQELQALKTTLVTRDQNTAQAELAAFAGKPEHRYFENVRVEMGALIQAGRATDLAQAYDMACWANPEVRTALIKETQDKAQAEAKRIADEAASKARLASKSITGAPNGNGAAHVPDRSLRDEIAAQFDP